MRDIFGVSEERDTNTLIIIFVAYRSQYDCNAAAFHFSVSLQMDLRAMPMPILLISRECVESDDFVIFRSQEQP